MASHDEEDMRIWKKAISRAFLPPPRPWEFHSNRVLCGAESFSLDERTLYELALLDIHAAYWQGADQNYKHLFRYHNTLQYEVERQLSSQKQDIYQTPAFLKSWLCRVFVLRKHDQEGRKEMEGIRKLVGIQSQLNHGDFSVHGNALCSVAFMIFNFQFRLEDSHFSGCA